MEKQINSDSTVTTVDPNHPEDGGDVIRNVGSNQSQSQKASVVLITVLTSVLRYESVQVSEVCYFFLKVITMWNVTPCNLVPPETLLPVRIYFSQVIICSLSYGIGSISVTSFSHRLVGTFNVGCTALPSPSLPPAYFGRCLQSAYFVVGVIYRREMPTNRPSEMFKKLNSFKSC
jgi:hypothetical protein